MPNASTTKLEQRLDATQRIFAASCKIISAAGLSGFSLNVVAAEAGISKGGLLHHFPSKQALLEFVLRQVLAQFNQAVDTLAARYQHRHAHPWSRAYIDVSMNMADDRLANNIALAAALAAESLLHELYAQAYEQWIERIKADGVDVAVGQVIRLTLDGVCWNDLFSLAPLTATVRRQVAAHLYAMLE